MEGDASMKHKSYAQQQLEKELINKYKHKKVFYTKKRPTKAKVKEEGRSIVNDYIANGENV